MDAANMAKLTETSLPCKAGWGLSDGTKRTGTIKALGPDYIAVLTDSGDTYYQAIADMTDVTIPLNQP